MTAEHRRLPRMMSRVTAVVAVVAGSALIGWGTAHATPAVSASSSTPSQGSTAVYTATETISAPPSSTFPGAGGAGDGWGVVLSKTEVFNIEHHKGFLEIDCHNQSDATTCTGYPKQITESVNGQTARFAVSGQPGMWLDQSTGHLYVFATSASNSDNTESASGGVVCIDTTSSSADPFCGFTVLGNSPLVLYPQEFPDISAISDPVIVGPNMYAFNYFFGAAATATEDQMYCFSTVTLSACPGQPYAVNHGTGTIISNNGPAYDPAHPSTNGCGSNLCPVPSPTIGAAGTEIVVPYTTAVGNALACFNTAAKTSCSGQWPVALTNNYPGEGGGPFPYLDSSGNVTGVCIPYQNDACFALNGSSMTTPVSLSATIGTTQQWNGTSVTIGPRVYLPNGNTQQVLCYDYATSASCTNFPHPIQGLTGLLYTVNPDPYRPTCLWINADNGLQLQDFDAFTGQQCQQNPLRVLASAVVVPKPACAPISWNSLQVTAPPRVSYTSGSVQFDDFDGNPLTGLPKKQLDSTGSVNLSGLNLTSNGLPQFLISLVNPPRNLTSIDVKLTWTADYSPECLQPGTTVEPAVVTVTKQVADGTPTVGAQDTFTLSANNAGPSDAGRVVVTDILADGLKYDSSQASSGSVSVSGQAVTWTIPDLGSPSTGMSSASLQIVVTVDTTASVTNDATFTQTTPNANGGTTGTSNTVTLIPVYAIVSLDKIVSNPSPTVGSRDTFTLVATNAGPADAGKVVVTDNLANGLVYDSSTPSVGTVSVAGQVVTWVIPDLGEPSSGNSKASLSITVTIDASASLTNQATFTQTTPGKTGGTSGTSNTVSLTPNYAVVTLDKSVSNASPSVGSQVTFTLDASNAGPSDAGKTIVKDVLPRGLSYDSSTPSVGSVSVAGEVITWTIPDLGTPASGTSTAALSVVVTVDTTSSVSNVGTYTATTPNATNHNSGSSNKVQITPAYSTLSISKTVSNTTPAAGARDTYQVRVANKGPDEATGVVVTDPLPGGESLVSATSGVGSVSNAGSTLTWHVGTLGAGKSAVLNVVVTVTASSGELVNRAHLTSTSFDPAGADQEALATAIVSEVVPATHTGEPWSSTIFWALLTLLGFAGATFLEAGRRSGRSRGTHARRRLRARAHRRRRA